MADSKQSDPTQYQATWQEFSRDKTTGREVPTGPPATGRQTITRQQFLQGMDRSQQPPTKLLWRATRRAKPSR